MPQRHPFPTSRRTLVMILIVAASWLSASPLWAQYRYVNSAEDLARHFSSHISRVETLALALYDGHPEVFGAVPRELVAAFMHIHDQAKLDSSPEFRRSYWVESEGAPFIERLWAIYGKGYGYLRDPANHEAAEMVKSLNATDARRGEAFFREHGLLDAEGRPGPVAELLRRLERIVDVVDRNSDPVAMEEFAIREQVPMGRFITDARDLALAEALKRRYPQLVRGKEFMHQPHDYRAPCAESRLRFHTAMATMTAH